VKALAISLALAASAHGDDLSITIDTRSPGLRIFKVQDALLSQSFDSHPAHELPRFSVFGPRYPIHENILTTVFWPGEPGNLRSAFDANWVFNAPHQNPYFFALPYTDLIDNHTTKPEAASVVPWFKSSFVRQGKSVLEGRWIQIFHDNKVAYATWADIGPHWTDDFEYVFLGRSPRPSGNGAALDVSPAVREWLGMSGKDVCSWRFIDARSVPPGPWINFEQNNVVLLKSK
jgi:hypothetical protein